MQLQYAPKTFRHETCSASRTPATHSHQGRPCANNDNEHSFNTGVCKYNTHKYRQTIRLWKRHGIRDTGHVPPSGTVVHTQAQRVPHRSLELGIGRPKSIEKQFDTKRTWHQGHRTAKGKPNLLVETRGRADTTHNRLREAEDAKEGTRRPPRSSETNG